MTTRYGAFTYRTQCRHCGQPLPVLFPAEEASCAHCLKTSPLAEESFSELLYAFDDNHPYLFEAKPHPETRTFRGLPVSTTARRVDKPLCDKCNAPLPTDRIADGETRDVFCASCGDAASTAEVPAWLSKLVPQARQIFSVDPGAGTAEGPRAEADAQAARPIVMACPQCGGTLRVTSDTARLLPCQFCSTDVYLPDPVWARLHPAKTVREWFVRFEGPTRPELAAERERRKSLKDQAIAHAAAESRELEIAREKKRAFVAVGTLYVLASLGVCLGFVSAYTDLGPMPGSVGYWIIAGALAIGQVVAGIQTATRGAELIRLRTGGSSAHLFSWVWIWVTFGLFAFPFGPIVLIVGMFRLAGALGASTVSINGRSTSVEAHKLPRGEGVPIGLLLMAQSLFVPIQGYTCVAAFWKDRPPCAAHRTPAQGVFRFDADEHGCAPCGGAGQPCCAGANHVCACDAGLHRVPREGTCR